jgi:hypothetical protein
MDNDRYFKTGLLHFHSILSHGSIFWRNATEIKSSKGKRLGEWQALKPEPLVENHFGHKQMCYSGY